VDFRALLVAPLSVMNDVPACPTVGGPVPEPIRLSRSTCAFGAVLLFCAHLASAQSWESRSGVATTVGVARIDLNGDGKKDMFTVSDNGAW
jgi:hypothetical protein